MTIKEQPLKKARQKYFFTAGITAVLIVLTFILLVLLLKKEDYNWQTITFYDWGEVALSLALSTLFATFTYQFKKQYQQLKNKNS